MYQTTRARKSGQGTLRVIIVTKTRSVNKKIKKNLYFNRLKIKNQKAMFSSGSQEAIKLSSFSGSRGGREGGRDKTQYSPEDEKCESLGKVEVRSVATGEVD